MAERRRERPIGPALDRSLIDRARNGDLDSFETIVRARMDAVSRLTSAILGDEADARDAAQETFVLARREMPRLRESDGFEAWFQRVAVNAARMTHRAAGCSGPDHQWTVVVEFRDPIRASVVELLSLSGG